MKTVEWMQRQPGRTILARVGLALVGLLFLVSGLAKLGRFSAIAGAIGAKGVPVPEIAAYVVIAVEVVGGIALIVNWQVAKATLVLAVFVVAATALFHPFWAADAGAWQNQLNHFLKNVAILGALIVAASRAGRA